MKKAKFLFIELFVLLLLFLGTAVLSTAQTKTNKNLNKTRINSEVINSKPIITQPLELKQSIPFFSNIKPINLLPSTTVTNTARLRPVATLPLREFVITPSSVNGTMTARDPYINNLVYIEFLNGDVYPGEDKVNCTCGSGLTYVKLVLRATAGKRYLVTTKVSPRNGSSFGLDLFSSGFVHRAGVTRNNEEVSIVLSSEATGTIELWMQCNDPNGAKRPWTFHSMTVEEIN